MMQAVARGVARSATATGARSMSSSGALPSYILNAPATETSTLDNGLRVASEGGHGETATVGVWIDAGSRYETAANNGVAHFLEHMAFKGTNKRTQTQLEMEVENMGGHLNAYTSREQTVYYAQVFKKDVPKAMDLLSDILLNSQFSKEAIERERGVILREMEEVANQQEEVIFDRLHETAYQNCGLGRTILGPAENVRSITRDDLKEYIDTHYTAPRMVVAGAGAVDHTELVRLAEDKFGGLASTPAPGLSVPQDPPFFTGSDIRFREDHMPVAHVALAVESAGWTDPNSFPLMVMQTLLGSWDRTSNVGKNSASLLGSAVAEHDLAHSVMSFNTCYKDTGLFGVYAKAEPHGLQDLTSYIMDGMVQLCHNVSDAQVARARTQLKSKLLMDLDGTSRVCEDIGRQMLTYGRRLTPAEVFARIDAVDVEAVQAAAQKYIEDQDHALAAVGSIYELPDYNYIRRRTYKLRW